jgi:hypothetical protein
MYNPVQLLFSPVMNKVPAFFAAAVLWSGRPISTATFLLRLRHSSPTISWLSFSNRFSMVCVSGPVLQVLPRL